MTMMGPLSLPALLLVAASPLVAVVHAEFRRFEGPIDAASNYVHYSEGYVVTPGYVDISHLVFESADGDGTPGAYVPEERDWDDDDGGAYDEDDGDFEDDGDLEGEDGDGGGRERRLDGSVQSIAAGSTVSRRRIDTVAVRF